MLIRIEREEFHTPAPEVERACVELVEVISPRTNAGGYTPVEQLFAALVREHGISLEIAADATARRFYARTVGVRARRAFRAQVNAACPQVTLRPAVSDPAQRRADEQFSVRVLRLRGPEYLPLRVLREQEVISDRAPQADPLLGVLAARRSALKARTQAANQLHALVVTAPDALRSRLRRLSRARLIATAAAFRPRLPLTTPMAAAQLALKSLAMRHQQLTAEIEVLEAQLEALVAQAAPDLVAVKGIGIDIAATLLATAGDNPDRLRHESAFAHLCGVAPIPASSGKTERHRLNRGGDRDANRALYLLAIGRMGWDPATRVYVERRTVEGLSKPEIIRCLKRYIARQLYPLLTRTPALPPPVHQPLPPVAPVERDGSLGEPSTVFSSRGAAVTRRGGAQRSRPRSGLDRRVGTESPHPLSSRRTQPEPPEDPTPKCLTTYTSI